MSVSRPHGTALVLCVSPGQTPLVCQGMMEAGARGVCKVNSVWLEDVAVEAMQYPV